MLLRTKEENNREWKLGYIAGLKGSNSPILPKANKRSFGLGWMQGKNERFSLRKEAYLDM